MHLQPASFEASTVAGINLWREVRKVFFQLTEVVEVFTIAAPFRLGGGPSAGSKAIGTCFETGHVTIPAAGDELILLTWMNRPAALTAFMLLASGGRGFRLKIGHSDSSPAVHRQAVCGLMGYAGKQAA